MTRLRASRRVPARCRELLPFLIVILWGCGRLGYESFERSADGSQDSPAAEAGLDGGDGGPVTDAAADGRRRAEGGADASADTGLGSMDGGDAGPSAIFPEQRELAIFGDSEDDPGLSSPGERARAVGCTLAGAPVVAGDYDVQIQLGGDLHTGSGAADAFLLSALSDLSVSWSRSYGSGQTDNAPDLAIGPGGEVYALMLYSGTVDFGDGAVASAGLDDFMLLSLDSNGAFRWKQRLGGTGDDDVGGSVAVDSAGNVYLATAFQDGIDVQGDMLSSNGARDVLVASFTSDGVLRWTHSFGGTNDDHAFGIAVDGAGRSVVTGNFVGTVDFGDEVRQSTGGSRDAFLLYLDAAGAPTTSIAWGGTGRDSSSGVALLGESNAIVSGFFSGEVDLTNGTMASAGADDGFLISFLQSGTASWHLAFGGSGTDRALDLDLLDGRLYVTGLFENDASFGALGLAGTAMDAFIARFRTTGEPTWVVRVGGAGAQRGFAVAGHSTRNLYVAGDFVDELVFGGIEYPRAGTNMFLARLVDMVP